MTWFISKANNLKMKIRIFKQEFADFFQDIKDTKDLSICPIKILQSRFACKEIHQFFSCQNKNKSPVNVVSTLQIILNQLQIHLTSTLHTWVSRMVYSAAVSCQKIISIWSCKEKTKTGCRSRDNKQIRINNNIKAKIVNIKALLRIIILCPKIHIKGQISWDKLSSKNGLKLFLVSQNNNYWLNIKHLEIKYWFEG